MTDTEQSGATFAPVADTSAPAARAETPAGNFGSTRGSGLARGKRPTGAAAPTASTAKSDYKPTAVEIITPAREYKNPFASPEPASAPASEPAKVEPPAAIAAEEPKQEAPAEVQAISPEPVAEKREIEILPPAETARPSVSWEAHSDLPDRPSQDERPTFRADRREDVAGGPTPEGREPRFDGREPRRDSFQRQPRDPREARQPRDPREARQPRDPRDERQPRDPRDQRQPRDPREARQPRDPRDEQPQRGQNGSGEHSTPAAKPATGGFLGWLKGLFGGKKPEEAPIGRENRGEHEFRGGERHRRRRRGGRGHGGNPQGFAGDRSSQGGPRPEGFQGSERDSRGGDRHGGHGRRRHRGGRGRDRGGDPRPEGHQGGGAI
jgi:translation initiation factor IF-2